MKYAFCLILFLSIQVGFCSVEFPDYFTFGVANAPGQVEDNLQDIWLDWAKLGHIIPGK